MKKYLFIVTAFFLLIFISCKEADISDKPDDKEPTGKGIPKPVFKPNHKLPRLTRFGYKMPLETNIEMAKNWGYALYLSNEYVSVGDEHQLLALAASNPGKYPVSYVGWPPQTHGTRIQQRPDIDEAWTRDVSGNLVKDPNGNPIQIVSPEAPDFVFERIAADWIAQLNLIQNVAPISMIVNGGEYALGVIGAGKKYWEQDPKILTAKGDRDWFDYISERKGHQENIIANAIRNAFPKLDLYVFYNTTNNFRKRYSTWTDWAWDYQYLQNCSDLPVKESYFNHGNTGWTGTDMLSYYLNAKGWEIYLGNPLSYDFLCGGWVRDIPNAFSDIDRYTGYLKMVYTAGMIGGNAGYYSLSEPINENNPPHWLLQMKALSHVHALFSYLDNFLYEGDLLPGPMKHIWSQDQPAYEFPVGNNAARVVSRKMRNSNEWIISAWASDGEDQNVKVNIPELGNVDLLARKCGSVYRVTFKNGQVKILLVDKNGMYPTSDEAFKYDL